MVDTLLKAIFHLDEAQAGVGRDAVAPGAGERAERPVGRGFEDVGVGAWPPAAGDIGGGGPARGLLLSKLDVAIVLAMKPYDEQLGNERPETVPVKEVAGARSPGGRETPDAEIEAERDDAISFER